MQNPEFIQKVLDHYNEELMPVPGTLFRYVSTDGERLKFRDKRDVNFYVRITLVDLARSRHKAGKRSRCYGCRCMALRAPISPCFSRRS
jgi:hypothetical protein